MAVVLVSLKLRFSTMESFAALGVEADRVGLHGVWLSEPWGFDATVLLGWLAARTERVLIGTHVLSVFSRTPAAFAGLAGSLQRASSGRFRLGLGASGPQVVEGWHGVPFAAPVARTRDVIAVVRTALGGDTVAIDGTSVSLPLPGGVGKALRFAQLGEPMTVPIYVAAMGDRNLQMAGAVADGWIPFPWAPRGAAAYEEHLAVGRAGRSAALGPLALAPSVSVGFGDVTHLRRMERSSIAFSLGAMGPPGQNFYVDAVGRLGFGDVARMVQRRWLDGDRDAARDGVSDDLVDAVSILGDAELAERRLAEYRAAGVDELVVELRHRDLPSQLADVRTLAELL